MDMYYKLVLAIISEFMERFQFVKKYPKEAQKQEQEWNKGFRKIVTMVTLWISSILWTAYLLHPEFQSTADSWVQKVTWAKK